MPSTLAYYYCLEGHCLGSLPVRSGDDVGDGLEQGDVLTSGQCIPRPKWNESDTTDEEYSV